MQAFQELTYIILIASVVSVIVHYLRQPLIIGYIISGILAGSYFLNIVTDVSGMELFSKLGIVILLFTIGLNLNPNTLKEAGKDAIISGLLQIILSTGAGFLLSFYILNFNLLTSIFIGLALAFSSTIVVLKIFSDKGQIDKLHSKIAIGILLIQDIVSAIILLLLSFSNHREVGAEIYSQSSMIWTFVLKALILLLIYYVLSKFVLKKLASIFASSQETLLLFGLASGFVMAFLFYKFGFSLEIGALFAGVAIASSNFAKEISSRLKPLQDFFIAMFFVLLGSNLIVDDLRSILFPIILMTLFVIVVKFFIVFFITDILGHRTRNSFYTAVSLTQVSEFSLIMLGLVYGFGYVDQRVVSIVTIVAMISIAISSYLMIYMEEIYRVMRNILKKIEIRKNNYKVLNEETKNLDAVIFGFDRVGREFVDVFKKMNYKYLVIDINPKYLSNAIETGANAIYGDAEDLGFLEENGILFSKMIISTIPHFKTNEYLVEVYRRKNPEGIIVATAHDENKSKALYEAGANYVIMPYHLGAYHASRMLLEFEKNPQIFDAQKEWQMKKINGESITFLPKKHVRTKRTKRYI